MVSREANQDQLWNWIRFHSVTRKMSSDHSKRLDNKWFPVMFRRMACNPLLPFSGCLGTIHLVEGEDGESFGGTLGSDLQDPWAWHLCGGRWHLSPGDVRSGTISFWWMDSLIVYTWIQKWVSNAESDTIFKIKDIVEVIQCEELQETEVAMTPSKGAWAKCFPTPMVRPRAQIGTITTNQIGISMGYEPFWTPYVVGFLIIFEMTLRMCVFSMFFCEVIDGGIPQRLTYGRGILSTIGEPIAWSILIGGNWFCAYSATSVAFFGLVWEVVRLGDQCSLANWRVATTRYSSPTAKHGRRG